VACNQLRWGGAHYFACAGLLDDDHVAFVSETKSGRWLACDDVRDVPKFIADKNYLAESKAQAIEKRWDQGDDQMKQRVPTWNGEAVWGTSRSTWIKYQVKGE